MIGTSGTGEGVLFAYLLVFAGSAIACFLAAVRIPSIDDPDTRRGLVALLLTSGGWASAHVGFLLAPTPQLKLAFYVIGLVVGLSAVGPWLYFCSAYTGRSLHRNKTIQRIAVALFLGLVLVKVTNPLHHLYFTTDLATTPFSYLAIQNQPLHWLVMGLSYALATVGYFMLFERFLQVSYDTTPLVALTTITGLPIILDVIGVASPLLIDITYEPIGVAVFAIGVAFVYARQFETVRLAGGRDDPVIVLDADGGIREYNARARELFPTLATTDAVGQRLASTLPRVAETLDNESSILTLGRNSNERYYRVTENPFAADRAQLGSLVTLTDITEREQYRQELERQNDRLEQFANMVSHDLRNPLEVANAGVELTRMDCDSHHLDEIDTALDRMDALIEDVLALARQGQPLDDLESVTLSTVAEQCWGVIDAGNATLTVESDLIFRADPDRFQQLLENLFRNAIQHGGEDVTIRVGAIDDDEGLYVADDGPGISPEEREQVFESGYSTATEGTGFGLAIVNEIVEAHGWSITVTESDDGGAQFSITDIEHDLEQSQLSSAPSID